MVQFNEKAIREAAYYIWKNGDKKYDCGIDNWNKAIEQLQAQSTANIIKQAQMFGTAKSQNNNIMRAASLLRKVNCR